MDLILFAAIALYLFLKLKGQFGKVDEDQKREAIKKFLTEQANSVKEVQKTENEDKIKVVEEVKDYALKAKEEQIIAKITDEKTQKLFLEVIEKSAISVVDFIEGSTKAFEIVIKSFANSDKESLKNLLSEDLFEKFSSAIDARAKESQKLVTNIVAIDDVIPLEAQIKKGEAEIHLKIISRQISYLQDEKGDIIDGNRDEVNEISDIWTLTRKVNSKNPNWTITSTKS